MATIYWIGKADTVAQQTTATVGGTISTETFTLTVGDEDVSYTAQPGDTSTEVADGLRDAWNGSLHPYCVAATATSNAGVVTLVADISGVPFFVTGDATGSATLTMATPTKSAGPNDWNTASNWSGGLLPANNDTVVIENCDVPILWGLDQASLTLTELRIPQSFTGVIGLPDDKFTTSSTSADETKPEYRDTYLQASATTVRIGEHFGAGNPTGSSRIKLDTGSNQTVVNVVNSSANSADTNLEPVRWIGTHASNVVNVTKGRVGIATTHAGEAATVSELNIGQRGNIASDADVHLGAGATVTAVHQSGGDLVTQADITTVEQSAGTLTTHGSASITTANIAGTAFLNATGAITDLRVAGSGNADFSHDSRPRIVTNCELHQGATLNIANGNPLSITFTNDISYQRCTPRDASLITDPHIKIALSAV